MPKIPKTFIVVNCLKTDYVRILESESGVLVR
jgi:hypothetical protein